MYSDRNTVLLYERITRAGSRIDASADTKTGEESILRENSIYLEESELYMEVYGT